MRLYNILLFYFYYRNHTILLFNSNKYRHNANIKIYKDFTYNICIRKKNSRYNDRLQRYCRGF